MRTLLVLLCLGTTPEAIAAPVPPARPVGDTDLVGDWDLKWGAGIVGPVTFAADGTYLIVGGGEIWPCRFTGRWWVDRGVLVLMDRTVGDAGQHTPIRHDLSLKVVGKTIVGTKTDHEARFVLTRK